MRTTVEEVRNIGDMICVYDAWKKINVLTNKAFVGVLSSTL